VTGLTLLHDLLLFKFPITFQRIDDPLVPGKELVTKIAVFEGGLVYAMGKMDISALSTLEHHFSRTFIHRSRYHGKSKDTDNEQTRPNPFHTKFLFKISKLPDPLIDAFGRTVRRVAGIVEEFTFFLT
jgi:hypothetical protein